MEREKQLPPVAADINPQEFVLGVAQGHQDYAMEFLIVEVIGTTVRWLPNRHMLAVQTAKRMRPVPG